MIMDAYEHHHSIFLVRTLPTTVRLQDRRCEATVFHRAALECL